MVFLFPFYGFWNTLKVCKSPLNSFLVFHALVHCCLSKDCEEKNQVG
jgi:hypothetical protein